MPKDLTRENVPLGTIAFQWKIKEYEQFQKSSGWYAVMAILGILLVGSAILTQNYLFALVIVLFGIILYLHELQAPPEVVFAITANGIVLGRKFYRFGELTDFWMYYNPPEVTNLYFTVNNVVKHRLVVPLLDNKPEAIGQYLAQFLAENFEQEDEPLSDRIARLLRIH